MLDGLQNNQFRNCSYHGILSSIGVFLMSSVSIGFFCGGPTQNEIKSPDNHLSLIMMFFIIKLDGILLITPL